jgi:hypothetical protein
VVPSQAKNPKFSEPAVEVAVYKQTPDLYLLHLITLIIAALALGAQFTDHSTKSMPGEK